MFNKIFDQCEIKPLMSIQKFNKLLCSGLISNGEVQLEVLTAPPINRSMCKKLIWKSKKEVIGNIRFNYCFMINYPIIKFISLLFSSIIISVKWCVKNRGIMNKIVVYDSFCPIVGNAGAVIGKMFNCAVVALYTDVPIFMGHNIENRNLFNNILKKLYILIDQISNKVCSGYILLTAQMNEVVNKNKKPFIVIEGMVDKNIKIENTLENKYNEFTILYAGGLYEQYGITNLINAVETVKSEEVRLLLYGGGELSDIIQMNYKNDKRIHYGGVVPNNEILEQETKATILVNPRFTNEEYTKYSFPSKIMEYMVSGTPVLTTRLKGIPSEYDDYLYFIAEESSEGVKNAIENLMNHPRDQLHKHGMTAREFVLKKKNNVIQAKKVINFIGTLNCKH